MATSRGRGSRPHFAKRRIRSDLWVRTLPACCLAEAYVGNYAGTQGWVCGSEHAGSVRTQGQGYSVLKATSGSILDARLAGRMLADTGSAINNADATMKI